MRKKIKQGGSLNSAEDIVDRYVYHELTCGENVFTGIKFEEIHVFFSKNEEENIWQAQKTLDKMIEANFQSEYSKGNNELVKVFNQECVICWENSSVYAF